jgi:hypothetical protein
MSSPFTPCLVISVGMYFWGLPWNVAGCVSFFVGDAQCFVAIQPRRQPPTRRSSWNACIPSVYARAPSPLALPSARHAFSLYTDIRFPQRIRAICLTSGSKQRLHAPVTGPLCGPCARRTIHFAMHARGINPATFAPTRTVARFFPAACGALRARPSCGDRSFPLILLLPVLLLRSR